VSRSEITDKGSTKTSPWFGYKYRVTPESSKLLQEAVFADGGGWCAGNDKTILHLNESYLLVNKGGVLTYTTDEDVFDSKGFPEKEPPHPKECKPKEFKVGYWYKCIGYCGKSIEEGKYYQLFKQQGGLLFRPDLWFYYSPNKFDVNSELLYNPATLSGTITSTDVNAVIKHFNQQEEVNMSTNNQRKTVTVNLIDRDSALDEKFALVATFGEFTTSKSNEALIRSIIIDPKNKVAELIAQHNEVRVKQTNKEIMERTGNKVTLEPVEESDLYWEIR